jgi:hypothetical protein
VPLSLALVLLVVLAPSATADVWQRPVPGALTRGFDLGPNPFEAGRHRGSDLAATPGEAVRAPCAGVVVFAGAVAASGLVATIRCGPWRVSHLPLVSLAVRTGAPVRAGALLGRAGPPAAGHAGVHVGVRREGRRFGYVDPMRFFGHRTPPPITTVTRPRVRVPRLGPARPPRQPPRTVPAPRAARAPRAAPSPALPRVGPALPRVGPTPHAGSAPHAVAAPRTAAPDSRALAPWPVWVGLALVLAGGAGWRRRGARRSRVAVSRTLAERVP